MVDRMPLTPIIASCKDYSKVCHVVVNRVKNLHNSSALSFYTAQALAVNTPSFPEDRAHPSFLVNQSTCNGRVPVTLYVSSIRLPLVISDMRTKNR